MNKWWTQADCALLVERWIAGDTADEIGKLTSRGRDAVEQKTSLLRRAGVPLPYRRVVAKIDLAALAAIATRGAK